MTEQFPNPGRAQPPAHGAEALPAEFDRELRAVDALLAVSARMHSAAAPLGLAQRVFDASIAQAQRGDVPFEALPAEFERDTQVVDHMLSLSAAARNDDAPLGLAQRVYEASAAHLPGVVADAPAPLRLVGSGASEQLIAASGSQVIWQSTLWRRLSLAASVAIVGGIALWAIIQQPPGPQPIAKNRPDAGNGNGNAGEHQAMLAAEVSSQFHALNNLALADDLSNFESEVAYLLDATQVLSVADLNHNFDALSRGMDM